MPNVENLGLLIAHMRTLRADQFDMRFVFRGPDGREAPRHGNEIVAIDLGACGTAACIAGECSVPAGALMGEEWDASSAGIWLGLDLEEQTELFLPEDFDCAELYPLARAIDVLEYFALTGAVNWGLFPIENYRASSPHAVEIIKPLPKSLTQYVREPATVEG